MKTSQSFAKKTCDKQSVDSGVSLSMMMALGMVMANGALADARANRERLLRRFESDTFETAGSAQAVIDSQRRGDSH